MKPFLPLLLLTLLFPACAQSLEQIVDEHHNARLNASFDHQPLRHGAGDGIGARNAHVPETTSSEDSRLSLAAPPSPTAEADNTKDH